MPQPKFVPQGVIPAVLLPFRRRPVDRRRKLPQASLRRRGDRRISAVTVNAHSTRWPPAPSRSSARCLKMPGDEIGGRLPIVNGVWADGSLEAARIARMAGGGRRCRAVGVPAGAVHARPIAGGARLSISSASVTPPACR